MTNQELIRDIRVKFQASDRTFPRGSFVDLLVVLSEVAAEAMIPGGTVTLRHLVRLVAIRKPATEERRRRSVYQGADGV